MILNILWVSGVGLSINVEEAKNGHKSMGLLF